MDNPTCSSCPSDDFYYESRFSESGDIGWKCLDCHVSIVNPKLDDTKLKEKVSCIVMDMQGCGALIHEDSSYSDLNESVWTLCLESNRNDEEFIISRISELSQVNLSEE